MCISKSNNGVYLIFNSLLKQIVLASKCFFEINNRFPSFLVTTLRTKEGFRNLKKSATFQFLMCSTKIKNDVYLYFNRALKQTVRALKFCRKIKNRLRSFLVTTLKKRINRIKLIRCKRYRNVGYIRKIMYVFNRERKVRLGNRMDTVPDLETSLEICLHNTDFIYRTRNFLFEFPIASCERLSRKQILSNLFFEEQVGHLIIRF